MSLFGLLRLPGSIVFGAGQRAVVGATAAKLGSRALICTDTRLGGEPAFHTVVEDLARAGVAVHVFDRAAPDVPITSINECQAQLADFAPQLVIGFGGGSCMDLAKALALLITHGGRPEDYYGENKVPGPLVPIIAIPTTAGTGSEVTPVAVLSDTVHNTKVGISSPHLIPRVAICDPELTLTCPPSTTAVAGADALTHAIESFTAAAREPTPKLSIESVFVGKNVLSDHFAILAITNIWNSLRRAWMDGTDIVAREQMMLAALAAGCSFATAGTAAAHAIQYPVGNDTHTAHGAGVAALLPYVMEFNRPKCVAPFATIARAIGLDAPGKTDEDLSFEVIDSIAGLLASIGIPRTLKELGLAEDRQERTAESALRIGRLVNNNPRPIDLDAMRQITRAAFSGERLSLRLMHGTSMAHTFTLPATLAGKAPAIPTGLLIGESWRASTSGKRYEIEDPSTGEPFTSVADATVEDGIAAVDAAMSAAAAWAAQSPRSRSEILRRCFEHMVANVDWLTQLISLENGKALPDARSEVLYAAEFFRWYAEEAPRVLGEFATAPSGANHIMVRYQPIGISLLVTPWNFPAAMATRKIAPALAAGCTVILKPAAETPLTALAIAQIMREAQVPAGVINVITTTAAGPVCDAILHDPRVRKVSFTGSTPVGRVLLREAADQVISSSMELGGNAPFLVFDDADIETALDGAMIAKMRNGGEACTAANRFYVQRGVYEAFAVGMVERMKRIHLGAGYDPQSTLGPMINQGAVDKINRLVRDAVSRGARLLLGGQRLERRGYYYPPTVLGDVPLDARLLKEEIFGPVVALRPFDTEEEAVAMANDSEFGLAAYVYTRDLKRGFRVCEQLETGMIGLNRGMMSDPAAPFGGMKQSGLGREGSHHGLIEFCEAKYVAVSW